MFIETQTMLTDILNRASEQLARQRIASQVVVTENFDGYAPLTQTGKNTVHTLYIQMGESPRDKNCKLVTLVQIFDDARPNLSLVTMIEVDQDGMPTNKEALFNAEIDGTFSNIILPLIYTTLNHLDPSGGFQGQVVQRYTKTRVLLQDLIPAIFFTLRLLLARRATGQLATIACDYSDRLTRLIATLIKPITRNPSNRVFILPATETPSKIIIPVPDISDDMALPYRIESTDALDICFAKAIDYLDDLPE